MEDRSAGLGTTIEGLVNGGVREVLRRSGLRGREDAAEVKIEVDESKWVGYREA